MQKPKLDTEQMDKYPQHAATDLAINGERGYNKVES